MRSRPGRWLGFFLRHHRRAALLSALCVCLIIQGESFADPIRLPQADGGTLELPRAAETLVTLSPNLTELVYAAGAGDRIRATVAYSEYPPAAAQLPRIGDAFRIDLEQVLALRPDLVLAWDSGNPRAAVARLRDLGITTWSIEIRSPEEIASILKHIGRATGMRQSADAAALEVNRKLARLKTEFANRPPVRYFYQVDSRPLFTINGAHLIARSLALCGGRNVFAEAESLAPQISHESVIAADPEIMFAPAAAPGQDPLQQWRDWPTLSAVRNRRLHVLPADPISQATPRLLDATASACRLMHQ
ncbi:cobalamin-binding protein [Elongatibacter sediminis]|uniref:Cobalamin-binding protein n=1 Tax=Elongatibacter sediminis TaxID=3119006 RepID=A0AAW9RG67_9GAMM